jgi:hypothetical protein
MKDQRPLTDAERAAVAAAKPIDEMLPRPTPDSQKELLERVSKGSTANVDTDTIGNEFDVS